MEEKTSIKNLMTTKVIKINPFMSLLEAVDVLLKNNFNGLPVVDQNGKLVGLLTEYDLIIKGSSIHLPTFIKLLKQFKIYRKDQGPIQNEVKQILMMKVANVMNREPLTLNQDASIEEAVKIFTEHHRVNPIPIIDDSNNVVGILSRFDLIKLFGRSSVSLKNDVTPRELDKNIGHFISDFGQQFVFVSKFRTHRWFIFSLLFALVGFFIAFAIIVRIE